jgi:hypothetical protein
MNIGAQVRTVTVEPIVDPVPDRDFPDRFAEVAPPRTRPTPRAGAAPEPAPATADA